MTCPHCQNEDQSMLEVLLIFKRITLVLCHVCTKTFEIGAKPAQL